MHNTPYLHGLVLHLFDVYLLMRDGLRVLGQLPASEPYAALPGFVHVNGGEVKSLSRLRL